MNAALQFAAESLVAADRLSEVRAKALPAPPILRETCSQANTPLVVVASEALVRDVCARVRDRADAHDVDVVVYCTCGRVRVHVEAFSSALYELIARGVDASRRGHPVIVVVREMGSGNALWQIHDAGEGMTASSLAALHEGVHHGHNAVANGVTRAYASIEAQGGHLSFESACGVGTTATVLMPHVVG